MVIIRELLFITNFVMCVCYQEHNFIKFLQQPTFSDKICSNEEIEFEASARNEVLCAIQCTVENGCNSFVYHDDNDICYGMKPALSCSVFVNLPGAQFYSSHALPTTIATATSPPPTTTTITTPLPTTTTTTTATTTTTTTTSPGLDCPSALLPAVGDSQITASSFQSDHPPHHARLDADTYWAPVSVRQEEYIQVNFGSMRVVSAIILQSACCYHDIWVKKYEFLTSTDCVNFTVVLDETDNPKVFEGNTQSELYSTTTLTPAVHAQCFRINPLQWYKYPFLRFELLGCLP